MKSILRFFPYWYITSVICCYATRYASKYYYFGIKSHQRMLTFLFHHLYCAFTFICFSIYSSVDKAPLFGKYYFTSCLFWQTKQQLVQNSELLLKHNLKTGPCWIVTLSVVLATTVTTRTLLWFHQRTCMRQLQLFLLLHPRHLVILDLCLFIFVLFCFVFFLIRQGLLTL